MTGTTQYRFMKETSCLTNMIAFAVKIKLKIGLVKTGRVVDVIYL